MSQPTLSVVIPSLNGEARLPETLASIASQQIDGSVQVIVVDDGSTDATAQTALNASLPWGVVTIVRHEVARGRARACNSGIQSAAAPTILILDDDMTLQPGALEVHRAFHDAHPGRAAIGRIVLAPPARQTAFSRFLLREERDREAKLEASPDAVPFRLCMTGHFSAARPLLQSLGGFSDTITHYGYEDIELAHRIVESGVAIAYVASAESIHRAYMTDLRRYLDRHVDVGHAARQIAETTPDGPFRDYLRVDGPETLTGSASAGLIALRASNRLLLNKPCRRLLGSRIGRAVFHGGLRAGEALGLDRLVHLGYHVARDLEYFQGYFGERAPRARASNGAPTS